MAIGKIIKQLLEERKRVILPGFGNLEVKESGGSFPSSGKRIDPPGSTIRFDSSFSKDDGLLATTLAREEQVGTEEAGQQVLELVDAIKFALDKGEPYTLNEAGIFIRDEDGKVHFRPEPGWVLEPEQYGLESMDLLELEELPDEKPAPAPQPPEKKEPVSAATEEKAPVAKEPVVAKEPARAKVLAGSKPGATVYEPWKREEPRRRPNRWRVIWYVAGVLIVVLVALIIIPEDRLDLFGKRDRAKQPIPMEVPDTGAETEDPAVSDESPAAGSEEPATVETEQAAELEETNNYFIIAGSFKHLGNASELQDRLKARGYATEVMVTENRMYRVSVASYATKQEAERALAGVKSEPGLESCWLLSNE